MAEECADDDDAKAAITDLRKAVLEELKMHNSFVQVRFGTFFAFGYISSHKLFFLALDILF